jgi:hypothetical protein
MQQLTTESETWQHWPSACLQSATSCYPSCDAGYNICRRIASSCYPSCDAGYNICRRIASSCWPSCDAGYNICRRIASSCWPTTPETNFNVLCTQVSAHQVSFGSANYWMVYNFGPISKQKWINYFEFHVFTISGRKRYYSVLLWLVKRILVFWDITPCTLIDWPWRWRNEVPLKVYSCLQDKMVSHCRGLQFLRDATV